MTRRCAFTSPIRARRCPAGSPSSRSMMPIAVTFLRRALRGLSRLVKPGDELVLATVENYHWGDVRSAWIRVIDNLLGRRRCCQA